MAKILLVLDQPDVLLALRQELRLRGHRVTLAADAERALECIGETGFDLVVVDLAMPVGDGGEVVEVLERRGQPSLALRLGPIGPARAVTWEGVLPGTVVELADAVAVALESGTGG